MYNVVHVHYNTEFTVINVQCTCTCKFMYVSRCGGNVHVVINVVINVQCTCMYPDVEEM